MQRDQLGFIQKHKLDLTSEKSINIIHHIETKGEGNMIISRGVEKAPDKCQHPFMLK